MRHKPNLSLGLDSGSHSSSMRTSTLCQASQGSLNETTVGDPAHSFSTTSRTSAIKRNFSDAISFMTEQEGKLSTIIENLESFISYTEGPKSPQTMAVYDLFAQSILNAMHSKYRGKPLFDNMLDKPLRIHIPLNGIIRAVDLPNPQLSTIHSLQGFVLGTGNQTLPSRDLVYDGIGSLLQVMLHVENQRVEISQAFETYRANICKFELGSSVVSRTQNSKSMTPRFHEFRQIIQSTWRVVLPSFMLKTT